MVLDGRFVEVNCSVFKPKEEEIKLYTFSLIIISFQQVRIADQAQNFSRGLLSISGLSLGRGPYRPPGALDVLPPLRSLPYGTGKSGRRQR